MQTKNLIKIIKAEASVLTALIDEMPNDGEIQAFEVDLLLNKIEALTNLANQLNQQVSGTEIDAHADKKQNLITPQQNELKPTAKPEPQQIEIQQEKSIEKKSEEPPVKSESIEVQISEQKEEPEKKSAQLLIEDQTKPVEVKIEVLQANDLINNLEETDSVEVEKPEEPVRSEISEKKTIEEKPVVKTTKHQPQKKQPDNSQSTLADKYQQESPSVNDMLAGIKKKHDLASTFHHQAISDLKKSIKINDRIRFINELFGKDSQLFEDTVTRINQSGNLDEALTIIFPQFNWDQESQTTIHFLELIFRRFQNV